MSIEYPANSDFEQIASFNPSDLDFIRNPYPILKSLRDDNCVVYDSSLCRWLVTQYQEGNQLLRNRNMSQDLRSSAPGTASRRLLEHIGENKLSMLFLDPPEHTRLRQSVDRVFSSQTVELYRNRAIQIVDGLLDQAEGNHEFDIVPSLSAPLSTTVISEILGVDYSDWIQFKEWSDLDAKGFDPFLSDEERVEVILAQKKLDSYFRSIIAERRKNPKKDLITGLITISNDEQGLTEDETVIMCQLLLRAGNLSTSDLISNGVLLLLKHPSELEKLQRNPLLITNAVEEILRFDSPVLEAGRISIDTVNIGETQIPAGQTVMVSLASANHDSSMIDNPDEFNITRENIKHLSFGAGLHFCLGAPLARMEAQVAIGKLIEKFPKIRLSQDKKPVRKTIPSFRGLTSLYVDVD
ncbi:MAG: cytochrome P450 [Patescibacteria group bacterium]